MAGFDYTGARGSNAGDSFHELWALRAALTLLDSESGLRVVTVEGIRAEDAAGKPTEYWEGVDCGLYYGGGSMAEASSLELVQLKYSASNPDQPWTVANLIYNTAKRTNNSVLARLGENYRNARESGAGQNDRELIVKFVTNRPVSADVTKLLKDIGIQDELVQTPKKKKGGVISDQQKLLLASGLNDQLFKDFCRSLVIVDRSDSRFHIQEQVINAVSEWLDGDARVQANNLLQYVRSLMAPERSREYITRQSVLAQFGLSDPRALFPCQPVLRFVDDPIRREQAAQIQEVLVKGCSYLCLHGEGGCGKTTLLQEIKGLLPERSLLLVYDCYGAGSYLHSDSYRHRTKDAFVQLSNELAVALAIPLVLVRSDTADYPRLFKERLDRAAEVLRRESPDALLVIAIDAADNAVTAAERCSPPETSFVPAFVHLGNLPSNVRLVVSARTGRKPSLNLPSAFKEVEIDGFTLPETSLHVARYWSGAPPTWLEDFHDLSKQNPRVQAYALAHSVKVSSAEAAIAYLRPSGKGLDDVFRAQIADAVTRDGDPQVIARFCASLAVMPRPVPLAELAHVSGISEHQLRDIGADLAPGVQVTGTDITLADEDFERFLQEEGSIQLTAVRLTLAERLWTNKSNDEYAARHVASSLLQANRERDLIDLVAKEQEPRIISDPILKREIQLERLGLAIRACSHLNDVLGAVRTLIVGTEAITTNGRIKARIIENADIAAACSAERASTLILTDPQEFRNHGVLLFHLLLEDAKRSDGLQFRERTRQIAAWMEARKARTTDESSSSQHDAWRLGPSEIAAEMEATILIYGIEEAIRRVRRWRPRPLLLTVFGSVARSLLARGRQDLLQGLLNSKQLLDAWKIFLAVPTARSGHAIDIESLTRGLRQLGRRGFISLSSVRGEWRDSPEGDLLDVILSACEIALWNNIPYERISDVIGRFDEPASREGRRLSLFSSSILDFQMRALSLAKAQTDQTLSFEEFWIVDRDANNKPTDSSTYSREREDENRRFLEPMLRGYQTRANILLKKISDDRLTATLSTIATDSALDDYRTRRLLEAGQMRCRAAESLAGLVFIKAIPVEKLLESVLHILGSRASSFPKEALKSLLPLALVPSLHSRLVTIISEAGQGLSRRRIPASERIDALMRFSRFILPISADAGGALFLDGLECASGIDEEVLMQIRVLLGLGDTAQTTLETRQKAEICSLLAAISSDAAVRLDSPDGFPWKRIAAGLSRLNVSFSLAAIARWEDAGIVERNVLLPSLLEEAVSSGVLTSAEVTALLPLVDEADDELFRRIIRAMPTGQSNVAGIIDFLAKDELLHYGKGRRTGLETLQSWSNPTGWLQELKNTHRFVQSHDVKRTQRRSSRESAAVTTVPTEILVGFSLVDPDGLLGAIEAAKADLRRRNQYPSSSDALQAITQYVLVSERIAFLDNLAQLISRDDVYYVAQELHRVLLLWQDDPAVRRWATTHLPDVIRRELVSLGFWHRHDSSLITDLLSCSGLPPLQVCELFVSGLVENADQLSAEVALPLVELVTVYLNGAQASDLLLWYSTRVFDRIPEDERDIIDVDDVPQSVHEALSRFLFAMMSDVDVRIRWRAAHVVRRLALFSCEKVLAALGQEGNRIVEQSFRLPNAPFYWLAARLWLTIAIERIARESSASASRFVPFLKQVVFDDHLPHVLLREFAKSALRNLEAQGVLTLTDAERSAMEILNRTPFPRKKKNERLKKVTKKKKAKTHRHHFDWMDTIPYLYDPWLRSFANVSQEEFLTAADRWIAVVWDVREDIGHWAKEERQHRFPENDYGMWSHRQGTDPILERPAYYYEWHAMWCTLGELLVSRPLAKADDWSWNDFYEHLAREMLTTPAIWLADWRAMKPLLPRLWFKPEDEVAQWLDQDDEHETLAELGLKERKRDKIVIDAYHATQARWFRAGVHLTTGMVNPDTANSLLRALQTTGHWMRYRVPPEGHDLEIDETPYRFLGWLREDDGHDPGIDKHDPMRNDVREVQTGPGKAMLDFLGAPPNDRRLSETSTNPPFKFEAWSDTPNTENQRRYPYEGVSSSGHRLWIDRASLQDFLQSLNMDMIVEVHLDKRDRGYGFEKYGQGDEKSKDIDHVFLLRNTGTIEGRSGSLGAWTTSGKRIRSRG
jgi:energy-coupling factor transporter ATP-binding protein EcfA2